MEEQNVNDKSDLYQYELLYNVRDLLMLFRDMSEEMENTMSDNVNKVMHSVNNELQEVQTRLTQ
jgi:hypothetical protein